jgi:glucose dehydrogenase
MLFRTLLVLLVSLPAIAIGQSAGNVTNERVLAESGSGENWFLKGGNFNGSHYSPLSRINEENIGQLSLAWAMDLPIPDGTPTTPIVVDGVIYIGGAYSKVVAVDASDGSLLWTYEPDFSEIFAESPWLSWLSRANRGVAVWDGHVYVATADCRLVALDAKTGNQQWDKQTCEVANGYSISDSPYVGGIVATSQPTMPGQATLYGAFLLSPAIFRKRTIRPH